MVIVGGGTSVSEVLWVSTGALIFVAAAFSAASMDYQLPVARVVRATALAVFRL